MCQASLNEETFEQKFVQYMEYYSGLMLQLSIVKNSEDPREDPRFLGEDPHFLGN